MQNLKQFGLRLRQNKRQRMQMIKAVAAVMAEVRSSASRSLLRFLTMPLP